MQNSKEGMWEKNMYSTEVHLSTLALTPQAYGPMQYLCFRFKCKGWIQPKMVLTGDEMGHA